METPGPGRLGSGTHRALVGLVAGVGAHVHDQHVLRLERLLLARTVLPAAGERLLVGRDVVIVDVLWEGRQRSEDTEHEHTVHAHTRLLQTLSRLLSETFVR